MNFENKRNFHSYFLIKCDFSSPYNFSCVNKPEERQMTLNNETDKVSTQKIYYIIDFADERKFTDEVIKK